MQENRWELNKSSTLPWMSFYKWQHWGLETINDFPEVIYIHSFILCLAFVYLTYDPNSAFTCPPAQLPSKEKSRHWTFFCTFAFSKSYVERIQRNILSLGQQAFGIIWLLPHSHLYIEWHRDFQGNLILLLLGLLLFGQNFKATLSKSSHICRNVSFLLGEGFWKMEMRGNILRIKCLG